MQSTVKNESNLVKKSFKFKEFLCFLDYTEEEEDDVGDYEGYEYKILCQEKLEIPYLKSFLNKFNILILKIQFITNQENLLNKLSNNE